MSYDKSSIEDIMKISRIKGNDDCWCPAVQIIKDHEGDAIWVASLIYNIYARYLECIPDSEQNDFEEDIKEALNVAFEEGMNHIDVVTDDSAD